MNVSVMQTVNISSELKTPSLSGHVQRSTAVLHCEERERQRRGVLTAWRSLPAIFSLPSNAREHLEDKRLHLCIVNSCSRAL